MVHRDDIGVTVPDYLGKEYERRGHTSSPPGVILGVTGLFGPGLPVVAAEALGGIAN